MKKLLQKIKSLKPGAVVRLALQILVYVNQLLIALKTSPFGDHPAYVWVSFGVTLVVTALSYWYNNDWTNAAKTAGEILDMMQDGKITEEEAKEFLDKHLKEEKVEE